MDEFNEKAVKKIVDAVDGDIAGLIDKLKATVALGLSLIHIFSST